MTVVGFSAERGQYYGTTSIAERGEYEHVFAFSGDGGDSWSLCGRGMMVEPGSYEPGNTQIE